MTAFIKRETVFCIALVLSLATAFINPPSAAWAEAIDWRTLGMLFCLMGVSEGLKDSGIFGATARLLSRYAGNTGRLSILLIAIVFFSSMLFTNDVALLMFVPFTIMMLSAENTDERTLVTTVVLETVAANLGSMTTPVGNPQNLFIVSHYGLSAGDFFRTILPYSLLSGLLIAVAMPAVSRRKTALSSGNHETVTVTRSRAVLWILFLAAALLSVFHILDWRLLLAVEAVYLILFDRKTLARIDYILLLTFVCFFIFSANLRAIPALVSFLTQAMAESPVATSALASQVISNVPAAILLSPLTQDFSGPLVGTNIGGLGTPVASLASLISLKIYFARKNAARGLYMAVFTLFNLVFLAILALASLILC